MGYIGNQSTKIVYTNLDRFKGELADITALNAITGMSSGDMYKLIDSNHAYMYDGAAWVDMGDIQGPIGPRGIGITSIVRTAGDGSEGTTDTYTITYEDTSTSTFDVKNGTAGTIDHITRTAGTGAAGTTDTYTVYADLAETQPLGTFDVHNGADVTNVSVIDDSAATATNTWSASKINSMLGGMDVSPIVTPTITTPTTGAVDFMGEITATYTTSASYVGVQDWVLWEAATDATFTTIVDSYEGASNLLSWTPSIGLALTVVYVRVKQGSDGHRSSYCPTISFTTPNIYVETPTLTVTGTPTDVPETPTLTTSAFSVFNGTDTHASTDWQVVRDSDSVVVWESLADTVNLLSTSVAAGNLAVNTAYTFRARHNGTTYGSSAWVEVTAKTLNIYVDNPTLTVEGTPNDVPKNPTISGSAFSVMNGTDTHESTDYQVVRVSDGVVVWESLGNTVNKTSIKTGDLVESTAYIFKMRYKGTTYGYSQWVQVTGTTKAVFSVAYGVEWDSATDTYLRTGAASGIANSASYAGAIQTQMRRCVLNADGTVKYYLDPNDSTKKADGTPAIIDGSDGNVMVEIPKFWSKYEHVSGVHKWSISLEFESGYEVDPAFIRGGVEKDYRYYPAYEGFNLSGKLISGSGRTPTVSQTRAQFRALAAANGAGWSQIDWNLLVAVQLLYLTEYADFDSQAMIGRGNDTGSDYTMTTGGSNSIGNASSPSTNNDMWMSYRGIENWYASMYKFIDGVNVQERKYFINSNPATFADDVFTGDYVDSGITSVATNGYVSNLVPNKKGFVASAVGGSDATYVPDQFYQSTGNRVVHFGGVAGYGLSCGAFSLHADAASGSSATVGSGVSF